MYIERNTTPFLRWAGGKRWLVKYFDELLNKHIFNNYHEPFLGGAAIFFSVHHNQAIYLSDINEELINTYSVVKSSPQEVIEKLLGYENTEKEYYRIRAERFKDKIDRAAQFIYLNQMSYNGLYRVNKDGIYNVPYGFRKDYRIEPQKILTASLALQKADVKYGDFTINKKLIKKDDLVFLDPPYTVSHNNNGFIEYNKKLFSLDDQKRLSEYIDFIKERGAYYVLTNAAHKVIIDIFGNKGDLFFEYERHSLIGGKNSERKLIKEFIFTNISSGVK